MSTTRAIGARLRRFALIAAVLGSGAMILPAVADVPGGKWIGTWAASPQPVWAADFFVPVGVPRALRNQTIRQVARVSLGGNKVRVVLSNEYGTAPVVIGAARIGLSEGGSTVASGSDRVLTFGGKTSFTIPPGAPAVSDPVDLTVAPLGSVAVSLFLPEITPTTTWHQDGVQTAFITEPEGDKTGARELKGAATIQSRLFLSEIQVDARPGVKAVVAFGDSITDGNVSTPDANRRWPDILAERLNAAGQPVAVLNQGISGARILRDRMGDNALARFDRDVLTTPYATAVVLMMGINDIGWPDTLLVPKGEPAPSAEDVIAGYKQLIERAHDHGLRIIGATLTPFEDTFKGGPLFGYYSEAKEAKRVTINEWIRTSGAFDAVIDFDAATRSADNPKHIRADYDSGDHLHPNDAGYKAMGELVDLKALLGN